MSCMLYYHAYPECTDYGNHDNANYEYELYSDHAEPDHCEYNNTQYHYNMDYGNTPEETKHRHEEPKHKGDEAYKGEIEGHELRELKHGEDETDKYKEGRLPGRHKLQGFNHEGEYGELIYELKHDMETCYMVYEPHRFKHDNKEMDNPIVYHNPHTPVMQHHTPTYIPPIPFPSTPSPTPTPVCAMAPIRTNKVT